MRDIPFDVQLVDERFFHAYDDELRVHCRTCSYFQMSNEYDFVDEDISKEAIRK